MNLIYQSPNYKPDMITNRYLHIDLITLKPVVDETVKTKKSNYTYRKYELPEEDYARYSQAIAEAERIKLLFPYDVELKENV